VRCDLLNTERRNTRRRVSCTEDGTCGINRVYSGLVVMAHCSTLAAGLEGWTLSRQGARGDPRPRRSSGNRRMVAHA
jgi:hypothetical protein